MAEPAETEQGLSDDLLGYIFESLPVRSLGAVSAVSRRWRDSQEGPAVWRRVAKRQGCTWGQGTARAEASAHRRGGWKQLVRHEHTLARRWAAPCGSSLKPRVIDAGHHWVPSILMDEATRELVTCSYDGTVRFWSSADAR